METFSLKILKNYLISSFAIILLTMLILQPETYAVAGLKLTLITDVQIYGLSDTVTVSGNLTFNENPVSDGIVALEVRDPADLFFSFRTVQTGSITPTNCLINFTQLYPSDSNGSPQYTFSTGSSLCIFFDAKNYDSKSHHVTIAITVYSPTNVPIGAWIPISKTLEPDETIAGFFFATGIYSDFEPGTYTIYANAYSNLPRDFGYPYCPEKTATFTVTGTTGGGGVTKAQIIYTEGTYISAFKLPRIGRNGTYTIYASSHYQGKTAYSSMGFPVVLIGDVNDDGIVEMMDFFYTSLAFGSTPEDPNWNEKCDMYPWPEGDNCIELMDFYILSQHFGDHIIT